MAINDFKNIENINLNLDSTAQLVESKDLAIFKTSAKNNTDFGMLSNDVIEFRIYDISNNLLEQTGGKGVRYIHKNDMSKYLKSEIDSKTQEKIYDIDVEKLVRESGHENGEYKVAFNFLKNHLGTENSKQRVWIHEVSPSRTEIRVMPLLTNDTKQNQKITYRYNTFLNKGKELKNIIGLIKNKIDSLELSISTIIDNYFVSKHGQIWLNVVKRDFQFGNDNKYTNFKQKIFKDFKNSVNYQLEGKDFDITSPTYGKAPIQKLDIDEYFAKQQIDTILLNRLSEAIEFSSKFISQIKIPQSVTNESNKKEGSLVLQSLLDTNYKAKSNLTQTNKITINKPKPAAATPAPIVTPVVSTPNPVVPLPQPTPPSNRGGGGFTGEPIDESRFGGGLGREQRFNNDVLNQQMENIR
jgi:hypothetical protein